MEGKAARLCPVLPCSGGDAGGERAREDGKGGSMRERMARGGAGERGVRHFGATRSPVCKQWCVCVCECARVRACVAVGGESLAYSTSNSPARRKRIRNDGTTADRTLNPSPAGARAASPPHPSRGSLRLPPPRPRINGHSRLWGLESPFAPALSTGRCGEQGALCRLCGPTGRRLSAALAFGEAPLLRRPAQWRGCPVM